MAAVRKRPCRERAFGVPIRECPALAVGESVNGWRAVEHIGKGGFGTVFKVVKRGKEGALKICSVDHSENVAENEKWRFAQEIEILEKSQGRFAPVLYEKGEHAGVPYFVMEYLDPVEARKMPKSDSAIARMMIDLSDALGKLHELGWVHCDIKPGNIARRANGQYVLIDFGAAHEMDPEGVLEHQVDVYSMNFKGGEYRVAGTKYYKPPELSFRPCRDVYALGHVLRDCFEEFVPFEWGMIINKCISWQPKHRYADMAALKDDIVHIEKMKNRTYWKLRKKRIAEHRKSERSLARAVPIEVDVNDVCSEDGELSSRSLRVLRIDLKRHPIARFTARGKLEVPENAVVLVSGPGILKADISGPSSSIVVLKNFASLDNTSVEFPPKNELLYAIVGPGSYLNFPNIPEKDRPKFFLDKGKRRIFRDMDATTAFRFGGPDAFFDVEQQTIDGLKMSNLPPRYRDLLIKFFSGEAFTVIPEK